MAQLAAVGHRLLGRQHQRERRQGDHGHLPPDAVHTADGTAGLAGTAGRPNAHGFDSNSQERSDRGNAQEKHRNPLILTVVNMPWTGPRKVLGLSLTGSC
jgi:hypothetical protein